MKPWVHPLIEGYSKKRECGSTGDEDDKLQEMAILVEHNGMGEGPKKIKVRKGSTVEREIS